MDYAKELAFIFSEPFAEEESWQNSAKNPATSSNSIAFNLIAPYIDEDNFEEFPNINELFLQFDSLFFNSKLNVVEVKWSKRMTLCAGLCRYSKRERFCSISLSEPLLKLRPKKDLVETLLHEMIHAYLFLTKNNRDRDGHGPNFCFHMHRINNMTGLSITIYHSFHSEVSYYRQHWWRCDGPCRFRPPFYGFVKRAMNRAPSRQDFWYQSHKASCHGKFIKVKEPSTSKTDSSSSQNESGKSLGSSQVVPVANVLLNSLHQEKLKSLVDKKVGTTSPQKRTASQSRRSSKTKKLVPTSLPKSPMKQQSLENYITVSPQKRKVSASVSSSDSLFPSEDIVYIRMIIDNEECIDLA